MARQRDGRERVGRDLRAVARGRASWLGEADESHFVGNRRQFVVKRCPSWSEAGDASWPTRRGKPDFGFVPWNSMCWRSMGSAEGDGHGSLLIRAYVEVPVIGADRAPD